jgi:beta-glucosidase
MSRIQNMGDLSGDEVPQVYLDAPGLRREGVLCAIRTLAAFDRVIFDLERSGKSLCMWRRAVGIPVHRGESLDQGGARLARVGSSSRDLELSAKAHRRSQPHHL